MNKNILSLIMVGAFALTGCMPGPVGKPVPKWERPADVPRYGDWVVEAADCTIHAATADVKAESDGKIYKGVIPVKLTFLMPLVRPPMVSMSGLPISMPLDGKDWTFKTYLAYDSTTVAHMMEPGTFLVVTYQPLNTMQTREVHFDTRGFLYAVTHVSKSCGKE